MALEYESYIAFGVLYDKLLDLAKGGRKRIDARRWVNSDTRAYGSFKWCCKRLGLTYEITRGRLLRHKKHELEKIIDAFRLAKDKQEEEEPLDYGPETTNIVL